MRLGDLLIQRGALGEEALREALARQARETPRRRLGEILVAHHGLEETSLLQALGAQFDCPVAERAEDAWLDPSLVRDLPVDYARAHLVLPVRGPEGPAVLTCDPVRASGLRELSLLIGGEAPPLLVPRAEVLRAIDACYVKQSGRPAAPAARPPPEASAPATSERDLLRSADQAPVVRAVNGMLLGALAAGASDVHLEPFDRRLVLRYRVDGVLYEQDPPDPALEAALVSRIKIMSRLDIAEKRLPQDGMMRVNLGDREIDVRVSTVPVAEGERVVLRLLRHDTGLRPLGELGLAPATQRDLLALLREPHGVIWVTGPTGSGKTTTLYAALQEIDTRHVNVMTIEDPVEYKLPYIGQIAVKPKIGLTFASGLRHILRQDPDVVLVGETRDTETAQIVVQASLTGHLVLSTLHTNDALGAVVRLVDMGVEPFLVAESLRGCLAQRLVRRLCPACKRPASAAERAAHPAGLAAALREVEVFTAAGCDACRDGYRGRVGVYELIPAFPELAEAIRAGERPSRLRALCRDRGLGGLWADATAKIAAGHTSVEEALHTLGRPGLDGA
jgi:general secretion pathway protein E